MSDLEPQTFPLENGASLLIREAVTTDAHHLLVFIDRVAGESYYLSFGAGEFELTEAEEADFLERCRAADNRLYIIASVEGEMVGTLNFSGGRRLRVRHVGEFGITVVKPYWGQGVGALLMDTLLKWAAQTGIVKKINLRVRTDNVRAVALYERKGFVKEGTLSREMFVGGRYYDLYMMSRGI